MVLTSLQTLKRRLAFQMAAKIYEADIWFDSADLEITLTLDLLFMLKFLVIK